MVPLLVMVAAGYVAGATWAALIPDPATGQEGHPLVLLLLSAQNRYLIIVVNHLDPVTYYVVGAVRLLLPDPLFYLLGYWYGDAAVRWMESRTATFGQLMRQLEVLFRRWGHPLVLLFPNNPICLLAGAARMPVPVFAILNLAGTIGRLVLFAILGEALQEPIDTVLEFIARYRVPVIILSVVAVGFTVWRETRQGTSEIDQLRRIEHELDEGGSASAPSDGPGDTR